MYNENTELFKKLIELGANPEIKDENDESVFDQCSICSISEYTE